MKKRRREECLNMHEFSSINEAREIIENYRNFYNNQRPHSSLGGKFPYECYIVNRK
ncbi:integrase core domain-containing protein [Methanocaldococcus sp.]